MNSSNFKKIIIHADMDAFFAAVEMLDFKEYRGKPLLIGSRSPRSVVSTASYEARTFGCKSAMSMVKALELCPHAIVVPPRMHRYKEISDIIMNVFSTFSPKVEPLSVDEAFLDMTGAEKIFGSPYDMAKLIQEKVLEATGGLTVSVGVSSTKFMAKVASDMKKPNGITVVPPDKVLETLWPLEISRIWGVGPKTADRLRKMGLYKIGQVAKFNKDRLEKEMGKQGLHIWCLANNIDTRELSPRQDAKSVGKEFTLSQDISGMDAIIPHLRRSADRIARTLRKDKLLAKGVRVKLKTAQFELLTRQGATEFPTNSSKELLNAALLLLKKFDLSRKYRLIGMATFNFVSASTQEELFVPKEVEKQKKLDCALDQVLSKFGNAAVMRGSDIRPTQKDEDE